MGGNHDKRLDKVEHSLTPKQPVVLWLEEARSYGFLRAYVASLTGQPLAAYPLEKLPEQVEAAVKDAYKRPPAKELWPYLDQARKDVAFLFELAMAVNARVLVARSTDALGYLWLLVWCGAPQAPHHTNCGRRLLPGVSTRCRSPVRPMPWQRRWRTWHSGTAGAKRCCSRPKRRGWPRRLRRGTPC